MPVQFTWFLRSPQWGRPTGFQATCLGVGDESTVTLDGALPRMTIEESRSGATLVMAVEGRVDAHSAQTFEDQVLARIQAGTTSLVLDFSQLDFISSAGLRVVLVAAKRLQQADGRFAVCGLRENVGDVFRVSGFTSIMDVYADRATALARLA